MCVRNAYENPYCTVEMSYLSDALTVGLVLILLFGSIALYLYTRLQQDEQKINLLESILLELKMTSEIKTYTELPAESEHSGEVHPTESIQEYVPFHDDNESSEVVSDVVLDVSSMSDNSAHLQSVEEVNDVEQYKSAISEAVDDVVHNDSVAESKSSQLYEQMSIKELHVLGKSRGISGASTMKKNVIIEALKSQDRSIQSVKPGSNGMSSGSFLENSEMVSDEL